MSDIDPNKMKVVELRAELAARNLDTKGNKAVLVKRLKIALNKETGNLDASGDDGADMSMDADASLEDSQLIDEEGQTKDESEVNSGAGEAYIPEEPTTEDESQAKDEEDEEQNDIQEEECEGTGDQEMKEEDEEEKKENSEENQIDGENDAKDQGAIIIDSVPAEEAQEKHGEKRKRSRSPNDKQRHRSRSRNRDHSRRHSRDRGHYRSRSKSPAKIETEPEEPFDDTLVALDKYNSDLNLQIDKTRYSAQPLTTAGFPFMWAGARASYGIKTGKVCFETKVVKHLDVNLPADEPNPHVVRVGFSTEKSSMQLGEEPFTYGYGGTGKMSTKCEFKDYGSNFGEGDVVTSFLVS
ncbi:heterogeneous nuclear ribonucleoprotein U-like [Centruroides sculpturatus]|uniref:heterogeneous nuclear ribonucleoprotein U-like n=1 Tax=Centruroides sculpturatus TaxID=218467 RepID=UPI000C6ED14C|nr:heterogeneous nuclear ribonucleoprotein U-like [Centruroides sculpturatus]